MYANRLLFFVTMLLCTLSLCAGSTKIIDSITVDMSTGPLTNIYTAEGAKIDYNSIHTANCSIITIKGLKESSKYDLTFLFHAYSVPLFLIIDKQFINLDNISCAGEIHKFKTQITTRSNNLTIFFQKSNQKRMRFTHIYYYSDESNNFSDTLSWNSEQNNTILIEDSSLIGTINHSDTSIANVVINTVKKSLRKNFGFFYIHYDIEPVRKNEEDLILLERLNYKSSEEWKGIFDNFSFQLKRIRSELDSIYTFEDTIYSSNDTIHTLKDFTYLLIDEYINNNPKKNKFYDQADPVQVSKEVFICNDDTYCALEKVYPDYKVTLPNDSVEDLQYLYGIVTNDERYNTKGIKYIYEVINPKSTTLTEPGCFSIISQTGLVKICHTEYINYYREKINKLNSKSGDILYQSGLAQRKYRIFNTFIQLPVEQEKSLSEIKSMLSFYIVSTDLLTKNQGKGLFNFDETTYLNNSLILEQNILQLHKKHLNYLKDITDYKLYRNIFLENIKKKENKASDRLNLILVLVTVLIGIFLFNVPDDSKKQTAILMKFEYVFISLTVFSILALTVCLYLEKYSHLECIFWSILIYSCLTLLLKVIRSFCLMKNVKSWKYLRQIFMIYVSRKINTFLHNKKNKKNLQIKELQKKSEKY